MKPTQLTCAVSVALLVCGCQPPPSPSPSQTTEPEALSCQPGTAAGLSYADADGDGFGAGSPVEMCLSGVAVPAGYATRAGDCDDHDASRWQLISAYVDADADGVGAGQVAEVCAGAALPRGASARSDDCAPDDPQRWQLLAYAYRDADGDGWGVASNESVCAGEDLPSGYTEGAGAGTDCDDTSSARFQLLSGFEDEDGDGVGVGAPTSVCAGESLPPGVAATSGDCAPSDASRWMTFEYRSVDRDGDGVGASAMGVLCSGLSLPAPYLAEEGFDCDDSDSTVYHVAIAYPDVDGDGVGARVTDPAGGPDGGPSPGYASLCVGIKLPAGYVSIDGDCAPEDASRWQTLSYRFVDSDGDGYNVSQSGTLCAGDGLPAGHADDVGQGDDCDDTDATRFASVSGFPDTDGDGVGAGANIWACTDGKLPAGSSAAWTDCAPDDATRWQALAYAGIDRDGDGATAREAGTVCVGPAVLPEPYRAALTGNDCDDAEASRWRWVVLYPDVDGDGVGARPREVRCLGFTLPSGSSLQGWDADDHDPGVTANPDEDVLFTTVL